jgi:hypothetical protein
MKILSLDSWLSGRDLNPGPPEYEAGFLTSRLRRSILCCNYHEFIDRSEDKSTVEASV